MSKFDDIKILVKRMFNKHHEESENEKDEIPSMIETEQPKILGVRRGVVIAIASCLLVTILIAFWWNYEMSSVKPNMQHKPDTAAISSKQKDADRTGLPNSYDTLAKHDKKNNLNGRGPEGPESQRYNAPQVSNQSKVAIQRSTEVPQIVQRQYSPLYQTPTYLPQQAQQNQENFTPTVSEEKEEKYNAAIAFALGTKNNLEQQQDVVSAGSQNSITYTASGESMLQAGTIIPAILMTGINSDVGGQVVAQIQADVYDSFGTNLLIPMGSKLIGDYSAGAANGQSRVGIKWNNLILPDGGYWSLGDSMIAIDGAGYAGVRGNVNNHSSKMLSAGAFTSALAALGSVAAGNSSSNDTYTAGQIAGQGAMSNLLNTASSLFQKNMNIQPTITVEPGYSFNVFVTKPISLNP